MREILFRGKRIDNGQWIYGYYVKDGADRDLIATPGNGSPTVAFHPVVSATVGQFTGLTDKNGKKIFEGDCFREDELTGTVIFEEGTYKIEWYGIRGELMPYGFDEDAGGYGVVDKDNFDLWHIENMEVIGNIHDNPELLGDTPEEV